MLNRISLISGVKDLVIFIYLFFVYPEYYIDTRIYLFLLDFIYLVIYTISYCLFFVY